MTEDERLAVHPNIYMERAGKGSREIVERLLAEPQYPLNEAELADVRAFEKELCDFEVDNEMTLETMLLTHRGEALEAPMVFGEAFVKGEVHVPNLEGTLRQIKTHQDAYSWLAQSALSGDEGIDANTLRDMAKQSANFYISESTQALLHGYQTPESVVDHMPIVVDSEKALRYARAGNVARDHLIELRKRYKVDAEGIKGAKRALVDIYLKRLNGLIASDIPVLEYLMTQSEMIGDEQTLRAAEELAPRGLLEATRTPEALRRMYKRLDYIRNGIGLDANGHASAVDDEVLRASHLEVENDQPPLYSLEQREILMNSELSVAKVIELFSEILNEAVLLSSEDPSAWYPGRGKRAADQLFQIVINPTKDNFGVSGVDGVLMVPGSDSSLYRILTVAIHELEHINQAQADQALGESLKIGTIKGRRISMFRETGANISQRKAEKELFGSSKPVALTYARAIQAFEQGESMYDATKAFYDEKLRILPGVGAAAAAKEASGNVLRLILGGGSNSQPMSYAEENIMNQEMADASDAVRLRATLITGLDLDDQERLHKYGLLPEPEGDPVDWLAIVLKKAAPYIQEAISK